MLKVAKKSVGAGWEPQPTDQPTNHQPTNQPNRQINTRSVPVGGDRERIVVGGSIFTALSATTNRVSKEAKPAFTATTSAAAFTATTTAAAAATPRSNRPVGSSSRARRDTMVRTFAPARA